MSKARRAAEEQYRLTEADAAQAPNLHSWNERISAGNGFLAGAAWALPEVPDDAVIEAMAATVHGRFRFSGWDAASEDDREDAIEMARAAYAALRGAMQ